MPGLFPVLCFPSIGLVRLWMLSERPIFEVHDHYQKQTFRNRYRILQSTGIQDLSIPVHFHKSGNLEYRSIRIDHRSPWPRTHWRSLITAYNNAPYFEHYADSLQPLLLYPSEMLLDFNLCLLHWLKKTLNLPEYQLSTSWKPINSQNIVDFRSLDKVSHPSHAQHDSYTQTFGDRLPFHPACSILDALFNLGPDTYWLLRRVTMESSVSGL